MLGERVKTSPGQNEYISLARWWGETGSQGVHYKGKEKRNGVNCTPFTYNISICEWNRIFYFMRRFCVARDSPRGEIILRTRSMIYSMRRMYVFLIATRINSSSDDETLKIPGSRNDDESKKFTSTVVVEFRDKSVWRFQTIYWDFN